MRLPKLKLSQTRDYTQVFGGLNRQMRPAENEFSDMMNLTSTYYPTLSPRDPRGIVGKIEACNGLIGKEKLAWVDGNTLHYGDSFTMELDADVSGERQLVSMGAYLIIHPDMMYVNTVDLSDHGYIKQDMVEYNGGEEIKLTVAALDAPSWPYTSYAIAEDREIGILDGTFYIYKSASGQIVLKGLPSPNDSQMAALFDIKIGLHMTTYSGVEGSEHYLTGEAKLDIDPSGADKSGYLTVCLWSNYEYEEYSRVATITVDSKDERINIHNVFEVVLTSYSGDNGRFVQTGTSNGNGTVTYFINSLKTAYMDDGSIGLYSWADNRWNQHDVYTDISMTGIGAAAEERKHLSFAFGEGCTEAVKVALSGLAHTYNMAIEENESTVSVVSEDKIRLRGGLTLTQSLTVITGQDVTVTLYSADPPIMDYLIESGNRLWGCRYGLNRAGDFVNEIYASAQGSFRDWTQFGGISTDSYTVSLGTDGPFTGAITYRDMPYFFKERCVHTVYGTLPENYQTSVDSSVGLQKGSHKSLCILGNLLYFKSTDGIYRYDGSTSEEISRALGYEVFADAVGGGLDGKYYIAQTAENGTRALYVYDTEKGLWHVEEGAGVRFFARHGHDLYVWDSNTKQLCTVRGTEGAAEEAPIEWYADSGVFGYTSPDRKYVGRVQLRIQLPEDSEVRFYIEYDGDGYWDFQGSMTGDGLQSFTVPIRPRRCDHFRVRLEGRGPCRLFSVAKVMEEGGYGI